MKSIGFKLIAILLLSALYANAQRTDKKLEPLMQVPKHYAIFNTTEALDIDGKNLEAPWAKAPWSEPLEDIEGKQENKPLHVTRFKLLWDNDYLYVYTQFDEEHIWAKLKEHDLSIFQDNALEIFIDPDGDTHNYMEFQINAFGAVWDMLMTKPYRNKGLNLTDWDVKGLKKAVYINGTLNNPNDIDKFWGIELAIPLRAFRFGGNNSLPVVGSVWKMNLTRVQWGVTIEDGGYSKKKDSTGKIARASYTCWSPQGIHNFHYPERWGYVRFAGEREPGLNFLNPEIEQLKLDLWKYYYLQQEFKTKNGRYAHDAVQLQNDFPDVSFKNIPGLKITGTAQQFNIHIENTGLKTAFTVDQEGRFVSRMLP